MAEQKPFNTDMDARRWAREFVNQYGGDYELMLAWFANALMCGWDNHYWTTPEYKALIDITLGGNEAQVSACNPSSGKDLSHD